MKMFEVPTSSAKLSDSRLFGGGNNSYIISSNLAQVTTKKTFDPIYELINSDIRGFGESNKFSDNANAVSKGGNSQKLKTKGSESIEDIENEILGTFLPTPATVQRVRLGGGGNNMLFGNDLGGGEMSAKILVGSLH